MPYTQNAPMFDAIQYTGDNEDDVAAAMSARANGADCTITHRGDSVDFYCDYTNFTLGTGWWWVYGTGWNSRQAEAVEDDTFHAKYTPAD